MNTYTSLQDFLVQRQEGVIDIHDSPMSSGYEVCPRCHGQRKIYTGKDLNNREIWITCPRCGGTGQIEKR